MPTELPDSASGLARRVWMLALPLFILGGVCFIAVAEEPFWCLAWSDVCALLVLPGLIVGGWLGLFLLSWRGRAQREMRRTLLLLPVLAAPSLFVALGCTQAYLDDLQHSPVLFCSDMPEYGSCPIAR